MVFIDCHGSAWGDMSVIRAMLVIVIGLLVFWGLITGLAMYQIALMGLG